MKAAARQPAASTLCPTESISADRGQTERENDRSARRLRQIGRTGTNQAIKYLALVISR